MKQKYLMPHSANETIFGYFPPEQDKHNFEQYLKSFPNTKYNRFSESNPTEDGARMTMWKLRMYGLLIISIPTAIGLCLFL